VGTTALSQGLILLLSMATAAITARWLGPDGKGQLTLLMLAAWMLQSFLCLGIGVANVYYVGSGRLSVCQLTGNSVAFALLGTLAGTLIGLLLLVGNTLHVLLPGVSAGCLLLAMVAVPLGLLSASLGAILQGLRRILTLNILSVLQAAIILAMTTVFVLWMKTGVLGAVAAWLAAQAAILVIIGRFLQREGGRFRPRWNPQVVRPTLCFGLKGHVGNLLQFFNYRLDAFLVNFFLGAAGVGIYGSAVALAELLWQLPNAVSYVLFPKSANSSHETMNRLTPRVFWVVLAVSAMGAMLLALFGKAAIRIIFSIASYKEFFSAYGEEPCGSTSRSKCA
jgi:O-antigen/teichoic acid export membrane protein